MVDEFSRDVPISEILHFAETRRYHHISLVDLIIIIYSNTHTQTSTGTQWERKINTSAGDLEASTVSQRTLALSSPTRLPLYDYHPTLSSPFHAPPVCTLSRKSSTRSAR